MVTIASILRDGEDPSMPALRTWLANLAATISVASGGFRTFASQAALNAYTPAAGEPTYAFVTDPEFTPYKFSGSLPWVADPTFFDGFTALIEPELSEALSTADAARNAVVPLVTATVATNTDDVTQYNVALPAGFDANANGQKFRFIAPATALGAIVRLNVSAVGTRDVFFAVGQQIRNGWEVTFSTNNGGNKFNLESQTPAGVDLIGLEREASAIREGLCNAVGADAILEPIGGNPNNLYADVRDVANDDSFKFYVIEDNTEAGPLITDADGHIFAVTECPAGTLRKGDIATIVYSQGIPNWIYRSRVALPKLVDLAATVYDEVDLVLKFVQDLHANQWNLASDHKPVEFVITSAGMSLSTEISSGREGAAVYSISHRITDLLNGYVYDPANPPTSIPAGARIPGTVVIDDNKGRGGKTVSEFGSQLNESTHWVAGTSRGVILYPGPNDWREGNYNLGQTFSPSISITEQQILTNRSKGMMTFLVIAGDPDNSRNDHAKFFTDNPGLAQSYPYAAGAPVDTETEQYPPASQSVGTADMTGDGVPILFDRRFEHGAAQLRLLAARYPKCVVVLDVRRAYQKVIEAHGSGAYAAGLIFNPPDDIHYLSYMHDRADAFPAMDMVQDALAGRRLKSVYDGGDLRNYGPSA